jgi:hypothetical protein
VYCNRLENLATRDLLRFGLAGNSDNSQLEPNTAEAAAGLSKGAIADQALQLATKGYVEFTFLVTGTDTNTGVLNLTTTLLVDFLTVGYSRRIEYDAHLRGAANAANTAILEGQSVVGMAATPVVASQLNSFTADAAAATTARAAGTGSETSGAAATASGVFSQSANAIILTLDPIAETTKWYLRVRVFPKVLVS